MAEVWEDVLGRDVVGINDNFFEMGGDSIKTIQISSRMNNAGYKLELSDIFQRPTIAELAPSIKKTGRAADQSAVTGTVPLTPIQKWFFETIHSRRYHFNQAVMLHAVDGFDEEAVRIVFTKLQEHHDALRMSYKEENGRITQTLHGTDYPFSLSVYHLEHAENAAAELERRADELQASINLETGPLMKLGLFRLDDGDRLLIVVHHLVIDGVSWRILFEDFGELYRQHQNREPLSLPLKTDSVKAWAEMLAEYANSPVFLAAKERWRESIPMGIPPIKKDFDTENNYVKDTDRHSFLLGEEETRLLLTTANEAFHTEINHILLTALGIAVKETFGNERLAIAMEGHGRERRNGGNPWPKRRIVPSRRTDRA